MALLLRTTTLVVGLWAATIAPLCPVVAAEELSAAIDRNQVYLGDSIQLLVTVNDEDDPAEPSIHSIPHFDIEYRGTRTESFRSVTVIVQGKVVEDSKSGGRTIYVYDLIPQSVGTFQLDNMPIEYKGKTYHMESTQIQVLEPQSQSDQIFIQVTADKSEVYLGQKILATFSWYLRTDIHSYRLQVPWLEEIQDFVVSESAMNPHHKYQNLVVNSNQEIPAYKTTEFIQGEQYVAIHFQKVITPTKTGTITLSPAFLRADLVKGVEKVNRGSLLDDFFSNSFLMPAGRVITEPISIRSNELTFNVLDVPTEEQPKAFTGAVGQWDWSVDVKPTHVRVGDPVTITMRIAGEGDVDKVELPSIPDIANVKVYEPEMKTNSQEIRGKFIGEKVFERVLVPTQEGVIDIPIFTFAYFDPVDKKYKTHEKGPFQIQVEGHAEGLSPAISPKSNNEELSSGGAPQRGTSTKTQSDPLEEDIRYIKSNFEPQQQSNLPYYVRLSFYLYAFVLPLASLLMLIFWRQWRRRMNSDSLHLKKRLAKQVFDRHWKEASAALIKNDTRNVYDSLTKAIQSYAAERWDLPKAGFSTETLYRLSENSKLHPSLAKLAEILKRGEQVLYSHIHIESIQQKTDVEQAKDSIASLEKF